jgi:ubiquitin carboxyl-terminal hydrolase 14
LEETIAKNSPTLNKESDYQRVSRISKLPLYLPIQFVRFFWKQAKNESGGTKQQALKILRVCLKFQLFFLLSLLSLLSFSLIQPVSFPARLDIYDLCSDSLKAKIEPRRTQIREEEDAKLKLKKPGEKTEEGTTMETNQPTEITENDSGLYDLLGVITHKGRAADGGHYVAWVRHAPNLWLKYDDDTVTSVREDEVLALDGKKGGDWHLAYMCIYASRGLLK